MVQAKLTMFRNQNIRGGYQIPKPGAIDVGTWIRRYPTAIIYSIVVFISLLIVVFFCYGTFVSPFNDLIKQNTTRRSDSPPKPSTNRASSLRKAHFQRRNPRGQEFHPRDTNVDAPDKSSPTGYEILPIERKWAITFESVCIEENPGEYDTQESSRIIVVYNSKLYEGKRTIKISTGTHANKDIYWTAHFKSEPIPQDHARNNYPAFFMHLACEADLPSFWHNTTQGLYSALKSSNRLDAREGNAMVYQQDYEDDVDCQDIKKYEPLLSGLNVRQHGAIWDIPPNTCFQQGMFASVDAVIDNGEIENRILTKSHVQETTDCSEPIVTIIQTKYRQILNIDKLTKIADNHGIIYQVIYFDNIDAMQRMKTVYCTTVLVGVTGPYLEWFRFMKKPAGLVEIGWSNWPPGMHVNSAIKENYSAITLKSGKVSISPKSWKRHSELNNGGLSYTDDDQDRIYEESEELADQKQWWTDKNIYKFADVNVKVSDFEAKFSSILKELNI